MHDLAKKVQMIAEELHCASAIIAAESIVEEKLKCEMENELRAVSNNMDKAVENEDYNSAQELLTEKKTLFSKINKMKESPRIRIRYAPLVRNIEDKSMFDDDIVLDLSQPATCIFDDDTIYIVLPRRPQQLIRNGLADSSDVWTPDMMNAKSILRYLTTHELGHIVAPIASEFDVREFAKELISKRDARDKARSANGNC